MLRHICIFLLLSYAHAEPPGPTPDVQPLTEPQNIYYDQPEDPTQHRAYKVMPQEYRDLVDKYGYDAPWSKIKALHKKYFPQTLGKKKRRKRRD